MASLELPLLTVPGSSGQPSALLSVPQNLGTLVARTAAWCVI